MNNTSSQNKKYQYLAGLDSQTGEIIYSRVRHDFVNNSSGGWIDGGSDYCRASGVEIICLELPVSPAQLYNDWSSGRDEYGLIKPVKILDENTESPIHTYSPNVEIIWGESKHEDRQSFAFKRKMAMWKTYGPKGNQPGKMVMLEDCETDHLTAILDTQNHISVDYREFIQSILKDRPKL